MKQTKQAAELVTMAEKSQKELLPRHQTGSLHKGAGDRKGMKGLSGHSGHKTENIICDVYYISAARMVDKSMQVR